MEEEAYRFQIGELIRKTHDKYAIEVYMVLKKYIGQPTPNLGIASCPMYKLIRLNDGEMLHYSRDTVDLLSQPLQQGEGEPTQ